MPLLAFRLHGPLAAWGTSAAGDKLRPTARHPGRSALIGLIAAGLGIERDDVDSTKQLASGLTFAVASQGPRDIFSDYRIVQTVENGSGKKPVRFMSRREALRSNSKVHSHISTREYVTDGLWRVFVAPKNEISLDLETLCVGLRKPKFHLYLGRRDCATSLPLDPQILESETLEAALACYPIFPSLDQKAYPILSRSFDQLRRSWSGIGTVLTWDDGFPGAPETEIERWERSEPVNRAHWLFAEAREHQRTFGE